MQPARYRQADFLLVEIDNAKSTSPAVPSGKEPALLPQIACIAAGRVTKSPV